MDLKDVEYNIKYSKGYWYIKETGKKRFRKAKENEIAELRSMYGSEMQTL